jgi:hypothetical protein
MADVQYITVKPLSGISPEQARDSRARVWAYVFQCWQEKQKAAGVSSTNGADAMKGSIDDRARHIIQEPK